MRAAMGAPKWMLARRNGEQILPSDGCRTIAPASVVPHSERHALESCFLVRYGRRPALARVLGRAHRHARGRNGEPRRSVFISSACMRARRCARAACGAGALTSRCRRAATSRSFRGARAGRWVDEGPAEVLLMRIDPGFLAKVAEGIGVDPESVEVLPRVQARDAQLENLGWALEAALAEGKKVEPLFMHGLGVALATRSHQATLDDAARARAPRVDAPADDGGMRLHRG